MKRIFFDFASSSPVDKEVLDVMEPYFTEKYGNPGSVHSFGQEAIAGIDHAREVIAGSMGAEFNQIIFTSSATEANNLALRGSVKKWIRDNASKDKNEAPHIIVSTVEHESVIETARDMEKDGVRVTYAPVDKRGMVDLSVIKEALTENTVLVSIMYAQNEVGTLEPIREISSILKEFKSKKSGVAQSGVSGSDAFGSSYPLFHSDAVQAFKFIECNVEELGLDFMTISSQKIHGPKGVGALFVRDKNLLAPEITGGGQEYGMRSATQNVPGIAGFGKAVELTVAHREENGKRLADLGRKFFEGVKKNFPAAELNGVDLEEGVGTGSQPASRPNRLPNIIDIYFPGKKAEDLVARLDMQGLAVSAGAACRSRAVKTSYVIEALGYDKDRASGSIRFSLGKPTTAEDVEAAIDMVSRALHD